MGRTTIEISDDLRRELIEERKAHESSYGDTIARLLNDGSGGQLWTEREIQDIAEQQARKVAEEVRR